MEDPEINYEFIKKWIGHGRIKYMAEKWGITPEAASKILKSKTVRYPQFVEACYQLALQNAKMYRRYLEDSKRVTADLKRLDPENEAFY